MDTICRILRYLANLEWSEKKQDHCIFCDRDRLESIVYEVSIYQRDQEYPGITRITG